MDRKKIEKLNSNDNILIYMFGKEVEVEVFSVGDNCFDETGNYKPDGFTLSVEEIECLNWFLETIKIEDYTSEILEYCNQCYDDIGEDFIEADGIEEEIYISAIAISIGESTESSDFEYPEIAFYGDCECDPEHGICIGFKDKQFIGVQAQDWIL
ncbi:MAG: hypothetical protein R3Y54_10325 [Eubacteriales bacterium]